MAEQNRVVRLVSRPTGSASRENFAFADEAVPEPAEGQFRVRVQFVSLDPAMRGWMNENPVYVPPIPLGSPMRAYAAGIVEASRNPKFPDGQAVVGMFGVQRFAVSDGRGVVRVDTALAPLERWIGGLGMPGATAYLGTHRILEPKGGETLVVSGAAGAVGSIVGQIGKRLGCRVVGIAGGPEKTARLTEVYGFDAAVDYKSGDLAESLREAAPEGVDLYFENVGGPVGNAVLHRMRTFGKVAVCGLIARYNDTDPSGGYDARATSSILLNRLKVQGFIVSDFGPAAFKEAVQTLAQWHAEGALKVTEDVREGGVDAYVETLNMLYTGENQGKLVLRA
jgi:NADPH-dependent curcumin reductase CurA